MRFEGQERREERIIQGERKENTSRGIRQQENMRKAEVKVGKEKSEKYEERS